MSDPTRICEIWGLTDPGRVRAENQDYFLVRRLDQTGDEVRVDPDSTGAEGGAGVRSSLGEGGGLLLMVADGMGGPPAGDVASRLALAGASDAISGHDGAGSEGIAERLRAAVDAAHERIRDHIRTHPARRGMGTTLTALAVTPDALVIAHVGDSRAYRFRDGHLVRLTRDQTLAQQRVDEGRMDETQARHSAESHVLLQAVGSGPTLEVAVVSEEWSPGDRLLVCSDGLSAVLDDAAIGELLGNSPDPRAACEAFVTATNEGGGPDNVTVVVAHLPAAGRGTGT